MKDMKKNYYIDVICTVCETRIVRSINLTKKEAEEQAPKLNLTSMFNAPKCKNKKCRQQEPYRDITLLHRLEIKQV